MLLYAAVIVVAVPFAVFFIRISKSIMDRRYYEKQGVSFTTTYPFIGSEVDVTGLIRKNKTRDYLYAEASTTDFIGCVRGFDIQLYAINRETTEILINPAHIGTYTDRDTPALYSFGQLSPSALTFTPIRTEFFHERKANILKGFDVPRMNKVSGRLSERYCDRIVDGEVVDMKATVASWTRDVMGEFVWGEAAMAAPVDFRDINGTKLSVPFMRALNETFTRLRFYSNRFWNRVYFPFATWPVTAEARRLQYNIRQLQSHLAKSLRSEPAIDTVSWDVMKGNASLGIPLDVTRDDLLTVSIAGLDTVQSMILATLWYLLSPENDKWRHAIMRSIDNERLELVSACINEAIRLDPPGSVINNKVIKDFNFEVSGRKYTLKPGTRVMPNIHALHAEYGDVFAPERFLNPEIKKDVYVMPFGKGRRSCPGRTIGMVMATHFVSTFLAAYPASKVTNATDEHIRFNNISRSQLFVKVAVSAEVAVEKLQKEVIS